MNDRAPPRLLAGPVAAALRVMPAVVVTGARLYWRTATGEEVDFVLEADREVVPSQAWITVRRLRMPRSQPPDPDDRRAPRRLAP